MNNKDQNIDLENLLAELKHRISPQDLKMFEARFGMPIDKFLKVLKDPATGVETVYLLTVDGGGIKGIIPLRYLQEIEKVMKKPIYELFDFAGGTSTGSIIVSLLTIPGTNKKIMSAGEALDFYQRQGPIIFAKSWISRYSSAISLVSFLLGLALLVIWLCAVSMTAENSFLSFFRGRPWLWVPIVFLLILVVPILCYYLKKNVATYSEEGLLKTYKQHFDDKTRLSDSKIEIGIVATDKQYNEAVLFNSYRSRLYPDDILHSAPLSKQIRSSSAAPTYFRPERFTNPNPVHTIEQSTPSISSERPQYKWKEKYFEDGGMKANNPTELMIELIEFIYSKKGKVPKIKIISLTTGTPNGRVDPTKEPTVEESFCSPSRQDGGSDQVLKEYALDIPKKIDAESHNVHMRVEQRFAREGRSRDYIRIYFKLDENQNKDMADASEENLRKHIESAEERIFKNGKSGEYTQEFFQVIGLLSEKESQKIRSQQPHNEDLEAFSNQFYAPSGQEKNIELKNFSLKKTNQQPDQDGNVSPTKPGGKSPMMQDLTKSLLRNEF